MGSGSPSVPNSGQLCLWRWLADGPEEAPCDPAWLDGSPVTTVMFSPKGRWLAATCTGACKSGRSAGATVGPVCAGGGARTETSRPPKQADGTVADGHRLLGGRDAAGGGLRLCCRAVGSDSARSLRLAPFGTYPGGGGWITTLDISADDRWLALGSGRLERRSPVASVSRCWRAAGTDYSLGPWRAGDGGPIRRRRTLAGQRGSGRQPEPVGPGAPRTAPDAAARARPVDRCAPLLTRSRPRPLAELGTRRTGAAVAPA